MKYGLAHTDVETICSVFARYPQIERVLLYGSRAKGNYHQGSDIDLTLIGEGLDLDKQLQIENDLDDLLLPYKMDVSIHSHIENAELLDHINRVGIIFYEKPKP